MEQSYYHYPFLERDFKESLKEIANGYFKTIIKSHIALYFLEVGKHEIRFRYSFIDFYFRYSNNEFYITIKNWELFHYGNFEKKEILDLFIGKHETFGGSFLKDLTDVVLKYQFIFLSSISNFLEGQLNTVIEGRLNIESSKITSEYHFRVPEILVVSKVTPGTITWYKRGEGWWDTPNNYCSYAASFDKTSQSDDFINKTEEYLNRISRDVEKDRGYRDYKFGDSYPKRAIKDIILMLC